MIHRRVKDVKEGTSRVTNLTATQVGPQKTRTHLIEAHKPSSTKMSIADRVLLKDAMANVPMGKHCPKKYNKQHLGG